jgi:hypothetical protein
VSGFNQLFRCLMGWVGRRDKDHFMEA